MFDFYIQTMATKFHNFSRIHVLIRMEESFHFLGVDSL